MKPAHPPRRFFPFYYGWAIVAAAFVEHILTVGLSNSQGVFFKPILAEFGWSRAMLSGVFSLTALLVGALAPFSGALADRYGPRWFIAFEALFLAAGYMLLSLTGSLLQFYLIFVVLIGLGRSAGMGSLIPTIPRWFEARRGLAQGIVQAGGGLGTVLLPPFVAYLILSYGWRFAFIVSGGLVGVVVAVASQVYRRRPQDMGLLPDGRAESPRRASSANPTSAAGKHSIASGQGQSLRQALGTRSLWLLLGISVTASFAHQLITLHLVPHATDKGFSPATAATFMSVIGMSNMLGKLSMGMVSDHIGRQKAMVISFSLASLMLLWLVWARELWAFYLFAALFGFAYGGWMPLFPSLAADLFGVSSLGAIFGTVGTSNAIGGALGNFLGGYIFDVTRSYAYAFLLAVALLLAGIGLILSLRSPRKQVI